MKNNHNGQRKTRSVQTRIPELGYYLIITDGKETEKNYFNGLRDSLPEDIKNKIVITTITTDTKSLKYKVIDEQAKQTGFRKTWVVFDKDQNIEFDSLIEETKSLGASVGWSNPCFEIWLNAYFGEMPNYETSTACCQGFAKTFKNKVEKEYKKNDEDIYKRLNQFGNETKAISIAETKLKEASKKTKIPSEMCPTTTVHELIKEIRCNVKSNLESKAKQSEG